MTLTLQPYPEYKDSGVEWLGQIPAHWQMRRTKFLFNQRAQKGFPEEPLLAATQTKGVVPKSHYESRTVTAQKDFHLLKLVEVGDYVISLRSFQGGIEYAHYRGIISPAYTILMPASEDTVKREYFEFFFKSQTFVNSLTLFVTGIREGQNIDYERLSRSPMPLPPVEEQVAIGRFLRHTLGKANRLIKAKRRLIELLNEQKQAIIHRAVTRGLDPDVPLKPSGIDWLGDIPAHWAVSRVKAEFDCLNTRRIPLSSTERGKMTLRLYDYYGASSAIDKVDEYLFDDDLLLIAEDGANLVLRNLPLAIIARGKFWVNNHAHILKPKRGRLEYLALIMEMLDYRPLITGAAQPKLTKDRLMAITIPVPSVDEQDSILHIIDAETASLRTAIEKAKQEVGLIREYRIRLIADVVNGKIDVREASANLVRIGLSGFGRRGGVSR